MKRGPKKQRGPNLDLFVFEQIKKGLRPSQIAKQHNLSKTRVDYYMSSLKRRKLVRKLGYGVWETCGEYKPRSPKKHLTGHPGHLGPLLKPDMVRGHAFIFTIRIPNLKGWDNRREILTKAGIEFKPLDNVFGGGESLEFKGRKIVLTNKSLVIYENKSYMFETSEESKSYALYELGVLVKSLEKTLGANFSFQRQYKIKVSRQHYALVKNALAKQYDREGKKLECYFGGDLWLIIDNSFNLHETETIHSETGDTDNKKVQNFFNGIKKYEGFTPEFVVNSIGQNAKNLENYAVHLKSHVESVQQLGKAVEKLTEKVEQLGKQKDI